jgi:hypothetical protein
MTRLRNIIAADGALATETTVRIFSGGGPPITTKATHER